MALGGGKFTAQDKTLPGSYTNKESKREESTSQFLRGVMALPVALDWGIAGEVIEIPYARFSESSTVLLGYDREHEKMRGLRDAYRSAATLQVYRLDEGGVKATCELGTAACYGVRGNDLRITVQESPNDDTMKDVNTYLGTALVDSQSVASMAALEDTGFIVWNRKAALEPTAAMNLTGGTNGTVTGQSHQNALDALENQTYNVLACVATEEAVKALYASYTKRMRDDQGACFQCAIHDYAADHIGIINVGNKTKTEGWPESSLVYWVAGKSAGAEVGKSNMNEIYDGEFDVVVPKLKNELEDALKTGKFILHREKGNLRVLDDINSFVYFTEKMKEHWSDNQTVRVADGLDEALRNDDLLLLGQINNTPDGRTTYWTRVIKTMEAMQRAGGIVEFDEADVTVEQGNKKKAIAVNMTYEGATGVTTIYRTMMVR